MNWKQMIKIFKALEVPRFVAYPYLDDPFDDIDNQDKYLLHNYNNSPDAGFSFIFNEVNNYYSQFCKHITFVDGSIDINIQLFNSYNQQLFISIFSIINSYNNKKYTIWNNINYLQYFYHLFPIHVDKFYSLFDRYVNPKIEELKGSIKSICETLKCSESLTVSFHTVSDLINSSQPIIKILVESLNTSIVRRHNFQLLVATINRHLERYIHEIENLNKVEGIKLELSEAYKWAEQEARIGLNKVKKKFSQHETDFKDKLCKYVQLIKGNFQTLHEQPSPKIGDLNEKIKVLYDKQRGRKETGKLVTMMDRINILMNKYDYMDFRLYMKVGTLASTEFYKLKEVGQEIQRLIGQISGKLKGTKVTKQRLQGIIDMLKDDESLKGVVEEISKFNKDNIDNYFGMIEKHKSKLDLFNLLPDLKESYKKSLDETKKVIKTLKELKEQVSPHEDLLDKGFYNAVTSITDIQDSELEEITTNLEDIIDTVNTTQNFIDNTKLFFGYLNVFKSQNSKIDKLNIEGNNISEIQKTIESIEGVIRPVTEGLEPIHKEKQGVEEKFQQTWQEGRDRKTEMSGIKQQYFPDDVRIIDDLDVLSKWKDVLGAIASLNGTLQDRSVDGVISDIRVDPATDIDGLLSSLIKIDRGLANQTSKLSEIMKISSSYEKNKVTLRRVSGFRKIGNYVETASQIPEKVFNLSAFVRWSIGLLTEVNHVTGILKGAGLLSGMLRGTGGIIRKLRKTAESMISELRSLESGTGLLLCDGSLLDIHTLGYHIVDLKRQVNSINNILSSLGVLNETMRYSVSGLDHYRRILFDILGMIRYSAQRLWEASSVINQKAYMSDGLRMDLIEETMEELHNFIMFLNRIVERTVFLDEYINKIVSSTVVSSQKIGSFLESGAKISKTIKNNIQNVELSIENVIKCFLKCSNKHTTENTIKLTKRMLTSGGQLHNNELAILNTDIQNVQGKFKGDNIWAILSNIEIIESKLVASKLFESITNTDEALKKISWVENCWCVNMFDFDGYYIMGRKLTPALKFEYEKSREFRSRYIKTDWGNYLCICLVINNILYPNLMRCLCYLIDMDFDALSTISRKFEKHKGSASNKSQVSRFLVFYLRICMKISELVYEKYASVFATCKSGKSICFCGCYGDVYYKYFISTLIYISSLVERIFDHPNETIGDSIQSLSALKAELENVKFDKQDGKKIRLKDCTSDKKLCGCNCECETKEGNCCCICIYCWIVCVCICLACKICKSLNGKCDNPFKEIKQLESVCKCDCGGKCLEELLEKCKDGNGCDEISNLKDLCTKCCPEKPDCCCNELKRVCKDSCEEIKKLCESTCPEKLKNCKDEKCISFKLFLRSVLVLLRFSNCIVKQIYTNVLLICLRSCPESKNEEIKEWLKHSNLSYNTNMVRGIRVNRIVDSTSGINNNKLEGPSDNHYSYNDAYRINTSRAHGSLKYIIIKMVLILIIVVMTIFITVKIETDDDYKMDNLLSEENGDMSECDTGDDNNKGETNNGISTTYVITLKIIATYLTKKNSSD